MSDLDVLVACKAEFHRRLRVYNEWKARTTNKVRAVRQRVMRVLKNSVCLAATASVPPASRRVASGTAACG